MPNTTYSTILSTTDLQVENKQLKEKYQKLLQKERHLSAIGNFASSLLYQHTVSDIVWSVAKNAVAKLGYVDCVIYLLNDAKTHLIQRAAHGPKNPLDLDIKNPIQILIGEGIVGTVAKTKQAEIIYDTRNDQRYIIDDAMRLSEIAVPIINTNGEVMGVIDSEHPNSYFYTTEDLEMLTAIASMTATKLMQAHAQDDLKRSNMDLEQFAYAASHDLQEPLRMIISYAQLFERRYGKKVDEEGLTYLHFMSDGAQRMNQLIRDLLLYSRINRNQESLKLINCQQVLDGVLRNMQTIIIQKNAKINSEELPFVTAIFSDLSRLFQNLISNALKFCQNEIPRIEINVREEACSFIFSVSDNGIGIAEEYHENIFTIFKRLHNRDTYEGTGVGLAICKKIVEHWGGKIWLTSKVGEGSTFYFTLPKQ
ncbi:MAG: ATP-binding protein [Chitinophagales bacterium]